MAKIVHLMLLLFALLRNGTFLCLPGVKAFSNQLPSLRRPSSFFSGVGRPSPFLWRLTVTTALRSSASDVTAASPVGLVPGQPTWQQSMLRIRDPVASLQFYRDVLGMTLVDRFDFPQYEFSLYFLTTLHPDDPPYALVPGTQEAHDYLWTMDGVTLELTHNHGTELEDAPTHNYHPGNEDGDGFGHVAFSCDDVYEATDKLVQQGVTFKKKPDEGVMQGLAFAYDPDGYWIEIVKRGRPAGTTAPTFNLSQTMLRVKDPKKSLEFYQRLGMTVVQEKHFPDYGFSLYFLASSANVRLLGDSSSDGDLFGPILELTHNHGTEDDETHVYYNGNEDDRQGFGHTGFLVDDVYAACDSIRTMGYGFRKEPDGGSMKGLAFAYDPDGYSIEIIKRGGIDFGDTKVVQ